MTNEEKARKLVGCENCPHYAKCSDKNKNMSCMPYEFAIAMAEWKDEQYGAKIDELKSQISILEKQIKLLKVCNLDKSYLSQEYRRGFDDGMKQSERNIHNTNDCKK